MFVCLLCFKESCIYALRSSKEAWPLRQLLLSSIYKMPPLCFIGLIDVKALNRSKDTAWPKLVWCALPLAYSEEKAKNILFCGFGLGNREGWTCKWLVLYPWLLVNLWMCCTFRYTRKLASFSIVRGDKSLLRFITEYYPILSWREIFGLVFVCVVSLFFLNKPLSKKMSGVISW